MATSKMKKCAKCGERAVQSVTEEYKCALEHDGRSYDIVLPDLTFFKCGKCESIFLTDEAEDLLTAQLRRCAGLLEPENIIANREALGLQQKDMADWIGVAHATLCRWERGTQLPQRLMDRVLREFFQSPSFRERWKKAQPSYCKVVISEPPSEPAKVTTALIFAPRGEMPIDVATVAQRGCSGRSMRNTVNNHQAGTYVT